MYCLAQESVKATESSHTVKTSVNTEQVAQLWQRLRKIGDFKKVRVNGKTDNDSLKDSHKSLRCRWQTRIIW